MKHMRGGFLFPVRRVGMESHRKNKSCTDARRG